MFSVLEHLNNRPGRGLAVAATLILLVVACEEQLPPAACGSISPVTIAGRREQYGDGMLHRSQR